MGTGTTSRNGREQDMESVVQDAGNHSRDPLPNSDMLWIKGVISMDSYKMHPLTSVIFSKKHSNSNQNNMNDIVVWGSSYLELQV